MLIRINDMKKLYSLFTLLSALLFLGACEKDGDKFFLSSPEESELIASTNSVVLTEATAKFYALSLAWTEQTLQISDARYNPTTGVQTAVQVSRTEDFSGTVIESIESGVAKTYSVAALNVIAYQLEATPEEAAPLYFRLAGSNGSNIDPVYSNVVKVMVTPYTIDMRFANIINKGDGKDSGKDLYAAEADGNYIGFMGAAAWEGFYLQEADGNIWHTAQSGGTGTPFFITTDAPEGTWDMWFPGQSGCYFVNVNTVQKQWTALWMHTLEVSGIEGITMEYKRNLNQWQGTFTASEAGSVNIQMNGTGKLYDNTSVSGADNTIDDAKAKDTDFAFSGSANGLTFSTGANAPVGNIAVNVPKAEECTLIIDLNDPQGWKVEVTEGVEEPEPEVSQTLYVTGINESGGWTFDNTISLYNQETLSYAGVLNVNSEWGYNFYTKAEWNNDYKYSVDTSEAYTAESGKLAQPGDETNIPAPTSGLYLLDVSISQLTYTTKAIGNQVYYSGLNDVWDFKALDATSVPGEFAGTVTITSASTDGIQILIADGNWELKFGGYEGTLYYKGSNIIDDKTLTLGQYTLTVNLIDMTYSYTPIN